MAEPVALRAVRIFGEFGARPTCDRDPDGTKNDDPATMYFDKDGNYVVRNDRTGDIVQVSNKNDPTWKEHGS